MDPNLPPLTQTDWFRDFEGREWATRMDDHARQRMQELDAEFEANRSEMIGRAIWGGRDPASA